MAQIKCEECGHSVFLITTLYMYSDRMQVFDDGDITEETPYRIHVMCGDVNTKLYSNRAVCELCGKVYFNFAKGHYPN